MAGLTAHPRQTVATFAVAGAYVVWFLWFVVRAEPMLRRAVGRLFEVRIEIEHVSGARWTFQAHSPGGTKAGFGRDRLSGVVMVVIWFVGLLVLPITVAAIVLMYAAGITPRETFGH